jgi:membrane protease YdiL (CAAX protease family)
VDRPVGDEPAVPRAAASARRGEPPTLGPVPEPDHTLSAPAPGSPTRLDDPVNGWLVGMVGAAVGFFVGLLGGGIVGAIVFAASGVDDFDELNLGWVAVAQMGLWFGLFGVPYLLSRFRGNGMERDFGLAVRWPDLPLGAFLGFFGQFFILALVYVPLQWFTDVTQEELSEPARDMADKATGSLGVVLLVLIVGIGAPIVEEIFYRGLVQRSLVRRLGPVWGIGIASVIFGLVHFQLLQLPALALAGVLFGVLAYRAGRLGPAIVAHVAFNMTAVIVLLSES